MDAIENILTRRSIRKFSSQKVEKEKIDLLLKAAMYAPSARNTQSWQFVVVTKRETLEAIRKVHPHASMLAEATLAIMVCADKSYEPIEAFCNQNCSAATLNILLAAHAQGLGSVWLGVYPREERVKNITELFKLPENIFPVSIVALGYPNETKGDPNRFLPERVHYEKW
ncbi:MAG TPA: nitroreductase family protein [Bacteroidales bacterium]|nr:nitroreductase family protein [Bacteroidales bacterium]HPS15871.1 nitroreductase family protein [Bacteroidales bacterium]